MLILRGFASELLSEGIGGLFLKILRTIFLAFDSLIFGLISYLYKMFTFLSEVRIFENHNMKDLANRVYIIVGVVALFMVAYGLINSIINPDNAAKDKNASFGKIAKNLIFAIIGIAIVPTIFDYAYEFQKIVLCNNVIPKLLLFDKDTSDSSTSDEELDFSSEMAVTLFQSFYYIKSSDGSSSTNSSAETSTGDEWAAIGEGIMNDDNTMSLTAAFTSIKNDEKSIYEALSGFDKAFDDGKLGYMFLISTIAGAYCAYVLLGFVIDISIRAVKLSYLQVIAPIPILTLTIPGQKKVFDNWLKKTKDCFLEVFVRIIVLTFGAYAVKYLPLWVFKEMGSVVCGTTLGTGNGLGGVALGGLTLLLSRAAFIVGIFGFIKQAPKMISELFPGMDSKGFKLGFKDAFAEAGGFQALGGASAVAGAGLNTAKHMVTNFHPIKGVNNLKRGWRQEGFKGLGKAAAHNAWQTVDYAHEATSRTLKTAKAGIYGFSNAKDAKDLSSVGKAASSGVEQAMTENGTISNMFDDAKGWAKNFGSTVKSNYTHYDSKKALEKASKMDAIKAQIDALKSKADAIKSAEIKDTEELYKLQVEQIQESYKAAMATATTDAEKEQINNKASADITAARKSMEAKKRSLQNGVLSDNKNAEIVSMRKKLADLYLENPEIVKEAMQLENHFDSSGNIHDEYGSAVGDDANAFAERIKNGTAFADVSVAKRNADDSFVLDANGNKIYEIKKSVILEMGKNLGTKSGQIKAEATEQANKKSDKK